MNKDQPSAGKGDDDAGKIETYEEEQGYSKESKTETRRKRQ